MNSLSFFRLARPAIVSTLLCLALVHASPAASKGEAAAEIAKLEPGYQAEVEAVKSDHEKWDKALETWYGPALEKVLAERAQAGDLDGALATKAERERMTAHTESTAEQIQKMPPALHAVRVTYDTTRKQIADQVAKRTGAANQKHLADLDALQKRLTQKNDIDGALLVKAEKTRFSTALAGGATIAAAEPTAPATPTTPAPTDPKPAAPTAGAPANATASEAMTALIGRWRWTNTSNGWTGTRTFKQDGTFKTEIDTDGKWELDGDKVVLHYEKGNSDQMLLPLDPKDTKVKISRGRTIGAVKEADE